MNFTPHRTVEGLVEEPVLRICKAHEDLSGVIKAFTSLTEDSVQDRKATSSRLNNKIIIIFGRRTQHKKSAQKVHPTTTKVSSSSSR